MPKGRHFLIVPVGRPLNLRGPSLRRGGLRSRSGSLPYYKALGRLENPYTGYGTARDKLTYGYFYSYIPRLSDEELAGLFYNEDVAAKLVEKRPKEAFRRGYELVNDKDQAAAKKLQQRGAALGVDAKFQEAWTWGRLYGGALLVIGAEAGDMSTPLDVSKVRNVRFLNVVDRRFASVEEYYDDPLGEKYGEPKIYGVQSLGGDKARIHESRVIRFEGPTVDLSKRKELGGWTYSVLQRPYDVLRSFASSFQAAGVLTSDASQAVFKIKGLFDMIASGQKERLQTRMQMIDMSRSSARSVLIDADGEEFSRLKTEFAGLPEMLDRMMMRLASASDTPVSILMGRSPAGQNATGDSDFQHWYDSISSEQSKELTPKLLRVYEILSAGKLQDVEVSWFPLYEPTEHEAAETTKLNAEADAIYIDKGVVIPEQVAIARFGSGNGRIQIDEASITNSIELERKFSSELEKARGGLSPKELAALSIAQGVSPIIVSSLIQAAGQAEKAAPTEPGNAEQEPAPKPGQAPGAARTLSNDVKTLERRYVATLRGVAKEVSKTFMRRLHPFIEKKARADADEEEDIEAILEDLLADVIVATSRVVGPAYDKHAKAVSKANDKSLESIGIDVTDLGTGINEEIARRRDENIQLVVQAEREYAAAVEEIFGDGENDGLSVDELTDLLLEKGDISESRAELIARDQTTKLNGAINQARQEKAGIEQYEWSTSGDERVRDEHASLEGQIFSWSDPPAVGHPGEDILCRCVAIPITADEAEEA